MAQVQQRSDYAAAGLFSRPNPGFPPSSPLPSINMVDAQPNHGRVRLPPIQLPPISDVRPQPPSDVFSIKSLLSQAPESSSVSTLPARASPPPRRPPTMQSFPRSVPESRSDSGRHNLPSLGEPRRPLEEPPMVFRPPASLMQPQPQLQPPQQPRYSHVVFDAEQAQRSPANSTHSYGRSYYSGSTEPSPMAPSAPLPTFPPPQRVVRPPPLDYHLAIRQQPVAARACGFGERDRRVIDPPPILELNITDKVTGAPEQDPNAMLALHCTLLSHDGQEDETEVPPTEKGMPTTRRLMGTLVASPYHAKDEHGVPGTFFVFPDLSCRSPGKYRLRFKLLRVDPTMMTPGAVHGSVASIQTDIFSVFTAKDFPGMRASSQLLKALRRQGLNVGVKKGSEARKGRGKAKKESSSEDEDEDHSDVDEPVIRHGSVASTGTESTAETSQGSKPKKKGKRRKREP